MLKITIAAIATILALSEAKGINCDGSGLCVGNKGLITQLSGQLRAIDPSETFGNGEHITCAEADNIGEPDLCLFYQHVGDRNVPVDEGNDVSKGELTANIVTNAIPGKRGINYLTKRTGINCRGSSTCGVGGIGHFPNADLKDVRDAVASGEEGNFGNNEHIACVPFVAGALCAFYQNIGDRTFTKDQTVAFLDQLRAHKCNKCGSIPVDNGNNVDNGELTVNYVG
ncbi:hypothetical protein NM208_g1370 [Fusarium decemcellulare]|uniref:Uncharacterized protein n=2 Tax=Fusarium decemcellulare TaxID=57161 RepID=A0ACC1SSD9_9HYPO|nr:hypothetical protein NM208_g2477 [Fusarium decemcellulare]KAJ3547700.1 hypothetical protein NM208_g1370 [Fusarium decemcellulare]